MINLVPNEEKKSMIQAFYYRLVVVFLLAIVVVVLISVFVLLPSYFISSVRRNIVSSKLEIVKSESINLADQQILTEISDIDSKLTLIEKTSKNTFLVSEKIISEIIANKISGIKISQISFEENEADGKKINIRGSASSRERLALFRTALEEDSLFKKVDLPISNFVQGSNIQFSLSLISF